MKKTLPLLWFTALLAACGQDQDTTTAKDTPAIEDNQTDTAEKTEPKAPVAKDDGLVANGAKPVKLAGGYKFTEGPAVAPNGDVYFTDIPNNRVHKWDVAAKKVSTFMENSGGANGLFFSKEGDLFACQGESKRVTSFYLEDGGEKELLADQYDGRPFNKPNDLWIHPNNGVFFTDPNYGQKELSQDAEHLYYVTPYRDQVMRVDNELKRPNGVVGTPDGKTLYVADPGQGKTFRYVVEEGEEGTLSGKKLFVESGSDGMTLDNKGNLYLTSGTVKVYDPQGKKIDDIEFPEKPSNVCFGGKNGKTLFVTARTGFYSLDMKVAGAGFVDVGAAIAGDEFKIVISCIKEKLVYDIKEFTTRTGQKVTVTFKNSDFPPHNLLFVKPGTADEVAALAIALGGEGFAKQFRPETDNVLWGSTMLDHGQEATINFIAPAPGDYPYICTFPGHHLLMRGVMHVVE
jgi:gluconolactonase